MKYVLLLSLFIFTSCDDSGINNLREFYLYQVGLNSFPYSNKGLNWDSIDGPDIVLEVFINDTNYFTSKESEFMNFNYNDLPIWFTLDSLLYLDPSSNIKIRLLDVDNFSRVVIDTLEFQPRLIFELPLIEGITSDSTEWKFHYVSN